MNALAQMFDAQVPVVETPRMILRGPRLADLPAFTDFITGPRSVTVGGPTDRNQAWRGFGHMIGHWVMRGYGFFVMEERATGAPIGTCGPWFPEGWPEPEIGWTIWSDAHEGKGYAHEGALASRVWAQGALGWSAPISLIAETNTRSQALAARLGCVREKLFEHAQFGLHCIWRHPAADAEGSVEAYA